MVYTVHILVYNDIHNAWVSVCGTSLCTCTAVCKLVVMVNGLSGVASSHT